MSSSGLYIHLKNDKINLIPGFWSSIRDSFEINSKQLSDSSPAGRWDLKSSIYFRIADPSLLRRTKIPISEPLKPFFWRSEMIPGSFPKTMSVKAPSSVSEIISIFTKPPSFLLPEACFASIYKSDNLWFLFTNRWSSIAGIIENRELLNEIRFILLL